MINFQTEMNVNVSRQEMIKLKQFSFQLVMIVNKLSHNQPLTPQEEKSFRVLQTLIPVYDKAINTDNLSIDYALSGKHAETVKEEKPKYNFAPQNTQSSFYDTFRNTGSTLNTGSTFYNRSYDASQNTDPPSDPEGDEEVDTFTHQQIERLRWLVMNQKVTPDKLQDVDLLSEIDEDEDDDEYFSENDEGESEDQDENEDNLKLSVKESVLISSQ